MKHDPQRARQENNSLNLTYKSITELRQVQEGFESMVDLQDPQVYVGPKYIVAGRTFIKSKQTGGWVVRDRTHGRRYQIVEVTSWEGQQPNGQCSRIKSFRGYRVDLDRNILKGEFEWFKEKSVNERAWMERRQNDHQTVLCYSCNGQVKTFQWVEDKYRIARQSSDNYEASREFYGVKLSKDSLDRVANDGQFCDGALLYFMNRLVQAYHSCDWNKPTLNKVISVISHSNYRSLICEGSSNERALVYLLGQSSKGNLQRHGFTLIPIGIPKGRHFILGAIGSNKTYLLDPLSAKPSAQSLSYFQSVVKQLTGVDEPTQPQTDCRFIEGTYQQQCHGFSCGAFVCIYAILLLMPQLLPKLDEQNIMKVARSIRKFIVLSWQGAAYTLVDMASQLTRL